MPFSLRFLEDQVVTVRPSVCLEISRAVWVAKAFVGLTINNTEDNGDEHSIAKLERARVFPAPVGASTIKQFYLAY